MKTINITKQTEIDAIINECDICFVGINQTNAAPYVIPMNFGYHDNQIFLHSAPYGKHLNLLELDNKISITFCLINKLVYQHPEVACSYRMDSRSVVCSGVITFIDNIHEKEKALNLIMQKFTDREFSYSLPALQNVKVWKVKIEEISSKAFGQKSKKNQSKLMT
ncbi:MAG: pyridoxamine 5'-phosphate oxidase family protein [Paludibacter sp.]|nr:pyridoxamine 5'-phosphate oxidase family protein [Paludibacter sp.]